VELGRLRILPATILTNNCAYCFFLSEKAAARALVGMPDLKAEDVARKAMEIAADMCVYTNHNFRCEILEAKEDDKKDKK
jgi:hypothetical protein